MNLEEQRQFILSGKVYNDLTPELIKARENTVFLTNKYNESFGNGKWKQKASKSDKSWLYLFLYSSNVVVRQSRYCFVEKCPSTIGKFE